MLTEKQLMNIVDEITGTLSFPEYKAQIWYMLFEMNIEHEKVI